MTTYSNTVVTAVELSRLAVARVVTSVTALAWSVAVDAAPPSRKEFGSWYLPSWPSWDLGFDWAEWWYAGGRFTVVADRAVRHPRDFTGPVIFDALFRRWELVATITTITTLLAVLVIRRLYDTNLKAAPGSLGIWEDLPRNLPGSSSFISAKDPSAPGSPLVWPGGRHVPVSSVVAAQRLRCRARWVRALEAVLGGRDGVVGQFVRGRWTPDLPSQDLDYRENYLLASIPSGARCLGGGVAQGLSADDKPHVYLVLDVAGECVLVFPELLAKLRKYSLFRRRDDDLLGALRTRAVEWTRDRVTHLVGDVAVAGAVALAMMPSSHELSSQKLVDRAYRYSTLPHVLA